MTRSGCGRASEVVPSTARTVAAAFDDSVEIDLCGDDDGPRGGAAGVVDIEDEVLWIEAFLGKVDDLKLPGNALDVILEELGNFDAVAEMSGRSSRTVRSWTGAYEYQKRTANGVSTSKSEVGAQKSMNPDKKRKGASSQQLLSNHLVRHLHTKKKKTATRTAPIFTLRKTV